MKEKVRSSLHCLPMLVMKHFNTHNVRLRNISEPLTPKTKLRDNRFYMNCVMWYLLCANQSCTWTKASKVLTVSMSVFRGRILWHFYFQKIIFLQLLQIWSSYCFHCDTDQLWMHTQSNNKTKCFKQILLTAEKRLPESGTTWVVWFQLKTATNQLNYSSQLVHHLTTE